MNPEVPWAVVIKVMFLILKNGKVLSFLDCESSLSAIAITAGTGSKAFVKCHLGKSCLYGVLFGYSQVRNQKGLFPLTDPVHDSEMKVLIQESLDVSVAIG